MKIATVTLNPAIDRNIVYHGSFKAGELNRVNNAVVNAGGKGINVSRMLKKLGYDAYTYGFVGGYQGKMLCDMLEKEGISGNLFTQTAAETRLNVKITDENGIETEINENGGPILEEEYLSLADTLKKSDADVFIIGGSTPKGLADDTVKRIVGMLKMQGKLVICDVSGQPLIKAVEIAPYMIKPNREEFCTLLGYTPKDEEYLEQAKDFYNRTGIEILLTLGKKGAVYSGRAGNYLVKGTEVTPKGFSGAGDTFLASYVYALSNDMPIREALRFGCAASLSKVCLEGTNLPDRADIESRLKDVTVENI